MQCVAVGAAKRVTIYDDDIYHAAPDDADRRSRTTVLSRSALLAADLRAMTRMSPRYAPCPWPMAMAMLELLAL